MSQKITRFGHLEFLFVFVVCFQRLTLGVRCHRVLSYHVAMHSKYLLSPRELEIFLGLPKSWADSTLSHEIEVYRLSGSTESILGPDIWYTSTMGAKTISDGLESKWRSPGALACRLVSIMSLLRAWHEPSHGSLTTLPHWSFASAVYRLHIESERFRRCRSGYVYESLKNT